MKFYILITIILLPLLICMTCVEENGNDADTTSHDFTWEIFEFGDGGANALRDIVIIDENNIWAVGEITIYDTNNVNGYEKYNAMHWNGEKWEMIKITVPPLYLFAKRTAIYVFSENDIWTGSTVPTHYDGTKWKILSSDSWENGWNFDGWIQSIWGTSSNNMYFGGSGGSLVHYDGSSFEKLETETTLDIQDIYGARNTETGKMEIIAVASDYNELELLNINSKHVSKLQIGNINNLSANALWFVPDEKYFVVGAGIHYNSDISDTVWNTYPSGEVTTYYSSEICGNGINDVFVVGSFYEVVHYNGLTWYNYENELPFTSGVFGAVSIKNDIVAFCGCDSRKAIIVIGKRNIN